MHKIRIKKLEEKFHLQTPELASHIFVYINPSGKYQFKNQVFETEEDVIKYLKKAIPHFHLVTFENARTNYWEIRTKFTSMA